MAEKTFTVLNGYPARDGRIMMFLRGLERPVEAETAFIEGTSVRIVGGKAVKATVSA